MNKLLTLFAALTMATAANAQTTLTITPTDGYQAGPFFQAPPSYAPKSYNVRINEQSATAYVPPQRTSTAVYNAVSAIADSIRASNVQAPMFSCGNCIYVPEQQAPTIHVMTIEEIFEMRLVQLIRTGVVTQQQVNTAKSMGYSTLDILTKID